MSSNLTKNLFDKGWKCTAAAVTLVALCRKLQHLDLNLFDKEWKIAAAAVDDLQPCNKKYITPFQ
jgi:hypothetical protein